MFKQKLLEHRPSVVSAHPSVFLRGMNERDEEGTSDATFTMNARNDNGARKLEESEGSTPCYPRYSSSTPYRPGARVSAIVANYVPCTLGEVDCPASGKKKVEGESEVTYNFSCKSKDWCGNIGYIPGTLYGGEAWTNEGACTVSIYSVGLF